MLTLFSVFMTYHFFCFFLPCVSASQTIKNCIGMAKQSKATAKSGLSGRSLKRRVIISPTGGNREERWTLLYKSVLELLLGDLTFSALLSMDDLVSLSKCCRSSRCFNQQIHTLSRWSGDFKGKLLSGKLPKLRRIKSDRPIGDCGVPGLVDLVTSVPKLDSLDVSGRYPISHLFSMSRSCIFLSFVI